MGPLVPDPAHSTRRSREPNRSAWRCASRRTSSSTQKHVLRGVARQRNQGDTDPTEENVTALAAYLPEVLDDYDRGRSAPGCSRPVQPDVPAVAAGRPTVGAAQAPARPRLGRRLPVTPWPACQPARGSRTPGPPDGKGTPSWRARAIDLAIGEHPEGPLFPAADGRRLDRRGAVRIVRRVTRRAGIAKDVSPHTLRHHAIITAALDAEYRSATCRKPPPTLTRAPPCATTAPAPASTGPPPTSSRPISQDQRGSRPSRRRLLAELAVRPRRQTHPALTVNVVLGK